VYDSLNWTIPGGATITTPEWKVVSPNQSWVTAAAKRIFGDDTEVKGKSVEFTGLSIDDTAVLLENVGVHVENTTLHAETIGCHIETVGVHITPGGIELEERTAVFKTAVLNAVTAGLHLLK
jgi:hypothetical protein